MILSKSKMASVLKNELRLEWVERLGLIVRSAAGCFVFQVENLCVADANDITCRQMMFPDLDAVDISAALTVDIEQDIFPETQAQLNVLARDKWIIYDDVIFRIASDVDQFAGEFERAVMIDDELGMMWFLRWWQDDSFHGGGAAGTAFVVSSCYDHTPCFQVYISQDTDLRYTFDTIPGTSSQLDKVIRQGLGEFRMFFQQMRLYVWAGVNGVIVRGDLARVIVFGGTQIILHRTR